jgi:outer membrane protein TolC
MLTKRILILGSALLSICLPVGAAGIQLSLDQALSLAAKNDLGLSQAQLEVESGDAIVREAYSAAMPTLDMSGALTHFMLAPSSYIPIFNSRVRFTPLYNASGSLSLAQPLWLAGKLGLALNAAKTYRLIANDALSATRAHLKADVIRAYYGLLLAREAVRVTEESLVQATRHSAIVKQMFEVGMVSELDVLRSQVQVKSLEPGLSAARKGAELAEVALKNRLGLAPADEIVLTGQLEADNPSDILGDREEAYQKSIGNRAEFRLIDRQQRLNEIGLKIEQRSLYWPNVFLGMGYSPQGGQDKLDALLKGQTWSSSATWTISASVPLFDGFATPARIQKAKIGLRKTEFARRQLVQGVRLEVTAALGELRCADEQVASARAAVELADKAQSIAATRYEQGMGTELDVLDAQLALHSAKLGLLQGLYDMRVADAEYHRVVENDDVLPEGR